MYYGDKQTFIDLQKDKWMEYKIDLAKTTFRISALYEAELNKDISEFNREELQGLLKLYKARSAAALRNRALIIKDYVQYKLNIECGENSPFYFSINDLFGLISCDGKYISPPELDDFLDSFNNYTEKVYFLAVYEGVRGKQSEEIFRLRPEDCDLPNRCLTIYDGAKREISDKLAGYIKKAIDEDVFLRASSTGIHEIPYYSSPYIIRFPVMGTDPGENIKVKYDRMSRRVMRKEGFTEKYTVANIFMSGMVTAALDLIEGDVDHYEYLFLRNRMKVKEIMERWGYKQPARFKYVFKEYMGLI